MRRTRPQLLAVVLAIAVALPLAHSTVAIADRPAPEADGPDVREATPAATGSDPGASRSVRPAALGNESAAVVVRNQTNTTNYLAIRDQFVEREAFGTASVDVGGSLAMDARELGQRHAAHSFDVALENAGTKRARVALVRNATARIESDIDTLQRRQQRTIAAYAAGEFTVVETVRRLATIDAAARGIAERLRHVRVSSRQAGLRIPSDLAIRINNVRAELVPLTGPVRDRVARTMSGRIALQPVYVQASSNGIVLATNYGDTHLREAYLAGKRRPGEPDQFANRDLQRIAVAYERASELYPWAYSIPEPPEIDGFGNSSVYNMTDTHPHGRLIAYLDGATRDVYRELQFKQLNAVPTRTASAVNGSLEIRVNRTHSTGPMAVQVTTDTGRPVNATVHVNGHAVGDTGDDGRLWTITPYDGVRIRAETADGSIVRIRFFARKGE